MKLLALFLVFMISVSYASAFISHVYADKAEAGKVSEVTINLHNSRRTKERLEMTATMPEFDVYYKDSFRIGGRTSTVRHVFFEIPEDIEPDYYPILVTVIDKDGNRERSHSWIKIN